MPRFNDWPGVGHEGDWSFLRLDWKMAPEGSITKYDGDFPTRSHLKFYHGVMEKLQNEAIPEVYRSLANTSFVSTYAASNFEDDFAETFANYVWIVLMHQQHVTRVIRDGKVVQTLTVDWESPLLQPKRKMMEQLLK